MSQSHTNFLMHAVWSTKDREPLIVPDVQDRLYGYIGGIVRKLGGVLLAAGGIEGHVHLLVSLHPSAAPAEMVRAVKANSSRWMREAVRRPFAWQAGYGGFSVSASNADAVRRYIRSQAEHHRTMTFQEEFLALLDRHQIAYDPRYVFA